MRLVGRIVAIVVAVIGYMFATALAGLIVAVVMASQSESGGQFAVGGTWFTLLWFAGLGLVVWLVGFRLWSRRKDG